MKTMLWLVGAGLIALGIYIDFQPVEWLGMLTLGIGVCLTCLTYGK